MEKLVVGERVQLKIDGISHQGVGVGRVNNLAVFVENALLGELVEAEITQVKSNMALAKLVNILQASEKRIIPPCPIAEACGGCSLQAVNYPFQLQMKGQMVQEALKRIGHIEIDVPAARGMNEPWFYRNKGVFHVSYAGGRVELGFFAQGSHQLIPAEQCRLFAPSVNKVVAWLKEALWRQGRVDYVQKILLRHSHYNGELMVVFITKDNAWRLNGLEKALMAEFPQITSVYHNVNTNPKLLCGKNFKLLGGKEYIIDKIGDLQFQISPQSFFQVNNVQAEVLYDLVKEYAALDGSQHILDLYCGIGTIGMYLAKEAKSVLGIESVAQAVRDAKENCALNRLTNCQFIAAKAEDWLRKNKLSTVPDVIIIDPPRNGCHQFLLDALGESRCEKIIYVSCNPTTLARDVAYLKNFGYVIEKIQPVDMFPQTGHVETIMLIQKENS